MLEGHKRSEIWKYFTTSGRDKAKCDICNTTYSFKGGTNSNLKRHLERKHSDILPSDFPLKISETPKKHTQNRKEELLKIVVVPEGSSSRKRSRVWNYFTKCYDDKAKCNLCNVIFSVRGGTTNLKKHLPRKHPNILSDVDCASEISESSKQTQTTEESTSKKQRVLRKGIMTEGLPDDEKENYDADSEELLIIKDDNLSPLESYNDEEICTQDDIEELTILETFEVHEVDTSGNTLEGNVPASKTTSPQDNIQDGREQTEEIDIDVNIDQKRKRNTSQMPTKSSRPTEVMNKKDVISLRTIKRKLRILENEELIGLKALEMKEQELEKMKRKDDLEIAFLKNKYEIQLKLLEADLKIRETELKIKEAEWAKIQQI